jgi:quercetin dioxygenase-like cupin family protein
MSPRKENEQMSPLADNPQLVSLVLEGRECRTPAPLNAVGEEMLVKARGLDTGGSFALFHLTAPPMTRPPLHLHTREDELWYVLEGKLVFQLADRRIEADAGTTIFAPRGTVHAYQNFDQQAARLLIMVTPAGTDQFFEVLSAGTPEGGLPDFAFIQSLDAKYGLTTLGPPLR